MDFTGKGQNKVTEKKKMAAPRLESLETDDSPQAVSGERCWWLGAVRVIPGILEGPGTETPCEKTAVDLRATNLRPCDLGTGFLPGPVWPCMHGRETLFSG